MSQRVFVPDCWTQVVTNPTVFNSIQVSARIKTPVEFKVSPYGQPFAEETGVEVLPGGRLLAADIALMTTSTESVLYARALTGNGGNVYLNRIDTERVEYDALSEPTYANVATTNFLARHNTTLTTVNANTKDVVMLGDSITEMWATNGAPSFALMSAIYPNVGNYGIGGNDVPALLWQIANGLMPRKADKVKVVTVLIGTNNNLEDDLSDRRANAILRVCRNIKANMPWVQIILHALFPRNTTTGNNKIKATNAFLAARHNEIPDVTYLDVSPLLSTDGEMNFSLFAEDEIHLNTAGYAVWWNALKGPLAAAYRRASK